jgi:hypothetical protein
MLQNGQVLQDLHQLCLYFLLHLLLPLRLRRLKFERLLEMPCRFQKLVQKMILLEQTLPPLKNQKLPQ